jgi:hydrogenase maturation protease
LHDFRWDRAIAPGRKIFREDFPTDITVYLIEAENLGLSPRVKQSAARVFSKLVLRMQEF